MPGTATHVTVDGRELRLTNLDKVLYPGNGFTKADVIDYYRSVAPVMLPHLRDMCPTLVRAPNGFEGQVFFEKRCPPHHPDWIVEGPANGVPNACVIDSLPHLVWTANLAALELHVQQTPRATLRTPRAMVFDLDPGPNTDILDCRRVAHQLRELLERLGLTVLLVKTSGSKGLHLSVPLNPDGDQITDDDTKQFALALGQLLEQRDDRITTNMAKDQRGGRVFVDWSQNDRHKTTIAPYSLRIRALPWVSTPITWDELDAATDSDALVFDAPAVVARVETLGDLWSEALTVHQELPALG